MLLNLAYDDQWATRIAVQSLQLICLHPVTPQIATRGQELERLREHWITDGPTRECIVEFMAYEPCLFRCVAHSESCSWPTSLAYLGASRRVSSHSEKTSEYETL